MGRSGVPAADGLLLVPGGSIHTFFMRFPLDAAFLALDGTVLRVTRGLRPWRLARAPRGTRFVLELEAGRAEALGLADGSRLARSGGWEAL